MRGCKKEDTLPSLTLTSKYAQSNYFGFLWKNSKTGNIFSKYLLQIGIWEYLSKIRNPYLKIFLPMKFEELELILQDGSIDGPVSYQRSIPTDTQGRNFTNK